MVILQYFWPTLSILVCSSLSYLLFSWLTCGILLLMITVFENEEDKPSVDTAKELVGGWVQLLPCPRHPDWQMLVNEEGKLHGLPYNQEASDICSKDIVGHAVLLKGAARWT